MRELAVRPVLWAALSLALTVAGVVVAVLLWLRSAGVDDGARLRPAPDAQQDAPGLSSAPQDELARQRREQQERLHAFGWVDQGAGIAHIPIDAAMDLLAARGRGARP